MGTDEKSRPAGTGRLTTTTTTATMLRLAARIPRPRRKAGVCWRCGASFTLTTDEVLRRCAELAGEVS